MSELSEKRIIEMTARFLPSVDVSNVRVERITKGGSDRQYWRLVTDKASIIFMAYTDLRADNLSFAPATEFLASHGVAVPPILAHDNAGRYLWSEDAGKTDLWDYHAEPWSVRGPLYKATLEQAAKIHRISEGMVPENLRTQLQRGFDAALYQWEQDYFFNRFAVKFSSLELPELDAIHSSAVFKNLATELADLPRYLVHRDFQSQNVIIRKNSSAADDLCLIDYQGVRPGLPEYDLASLLLDPYVDLSEEEREQLLQHYREFRADDDEWQWNSTLYAKCAAQRLMQALGAYGYLGEVLGKREFLQHIPIAATRLRAIITRANILPDLVAVLNLNDIEGIASEG
ncbi:MAG: aminoglycoside/choline kinase family phosphotransferase [Verrucomicrobiales bacterium]|jgi:aminoglycoside/choline kinase family phosphotransferase